MPDRADYLAKTLLSRLRSLEGVLREDEAAPAQQQQRRRELVAKVLAVETGLVDDASTQLVLSALPNLSGDRAPGDRDQRDLADFLRRRLKTLEV